MINNCAEKVKDGGTLAYSTCSITLEENEGIIEALLKRTLMSSSWWILNPKSVIPA